MGKNIKENFVPQDNDYNVMDDSREELNLEYDEIGAAHDEEMRNARGHFSDAPLRKGEKVLLYGKYAGYVAEDEDMDSDKITLTSEDGSDTLVCNKSDVEVERNLNENKNLKANNMKKIMNENEMRNLVYKMVCESLAGLSDNKDFDIEAIVGAIVDYALTKDVQGDEYITQAKRDQIMNEELDDAIAEWAQRTIAKNQRESAEGNAEPFQSEEDVVEHMKNSASYKRFFYTVKKQNNLVARGKMSKEDMSHHNGERRFNKSLLKKDTQPAGIPDALQESIVKHLTEALKDVIK